MRNLKRKAALAEVTNLADYLVAQCVHISQEGAPPAHSHTGITFHKYRRNGRLLRSASASTQVLQTLLVISEIENINLVFI